MTSVLLGQRGVDLRDDLPTGGFWDHGAHYDALLPAAILPSHEMHEPIRNVDVPRRDERHRHVFDLDRFFDQPTPPLPLARHLGTGFAGGGLSSNV